MNRDQIAEVIEGWRPVVGWAGYYEVSCRGRVRSVGRTSTRRDGTIQTWAPRTMRPTTTKKGYLLVKLSRPGERKDARVHRLVAEAFLPEAHTTETVNHLDGRKTNNAVENLEWATRAENVAHAIRNGLGEYLPPRGVGEASATSKLTEEMVLKYRREHRAGAGIRTLARAAGVHPKTMRCALSGATWAHIPQPPGDAG